MSLEICLRVSLVVTDTTARSSQMKRQATTARTAPRPPRRNPVMALAGPEKSVVIYRDALAGSVFLERWIRLAFNSEGSCSLL